MILSSVLLAAALSCPEPTLIGFEKGMTENDKSSLAMAKTRCGELYPNSPCVSLFQKVEELQYRVICGPDKKN